MWVSRSATLVLLSAAAGLAQLSSLPRFETFQYIPTNEVFFEPKAGSEVKLKFKHRPTAYNFPFRVVSVMATVDSVSLDLVPDSLQPPLCRGCVTWPPKEYFWGGVLSLKGLAYGRKTIRIVSADTSAFRDTLRLEITYNSPPTYTLDISDTAVLLDPETQRLHFRIECQDAESACDIGIEFGGMGGTLKASNRQSVDTLLQVAVGTQSYPISFQVWDSQGYRTPLRTLIWKMVKKRPWFFRPGLRDTTDFAAVPPNGNNMLQTSGAWSAYLKPGRDGGYDLLREKAGAIDTVYSQPGRAPALRFLNDRGEVLYADDTYQYLDFPGQGSRRICAYVPSIGFYRDGSWFLNTDGFTYVMDFSAVPNALAYRKTRVSTEPGGPRKSRIDAKIRFPWRNGPVDAAGSRR